MITVASYTELSDSKSPHQYVWRGRLDDRYEVVVIRGEEPYMGELFIFKVDEEGDVEDPVLHQEDVNLSYNAQFGPDVDDVETWQNIAIKYADTPTVSLGDILKE